MKRLDLPLALTLAAACQFPSYSVAPQEQGGSAGSAAVDLNVPGSHAGAPSVPNPCLQSPCQNQGQCIPTLTGSLVCLCEPGYRGDFCEAAFDNCNPDPCLNGGTCLDGDNTAYCNCPLGFEGATCERDHDDCVDQPCQNGGACVDGSNSRTCNCSPGFTGQDCEQGALATCLAIQDRNPAAPAGVYAVDPDGPGQGNPPLEVFCDMNTDAWMLVGQEVAGAMGTLKFLGVTAGDPSAAAHADGNALVGAQFRGLYEEVWTTWSNDSDDGDGIYFRVNEEMFANNVRLAMPVADFYTTNSTLQDWVNAAGGAVLCRASESPGVRPGDSSWGIKPQDDSHDLCGCNSHGWTGRGAFYGGHSDPTLCNPSGGGWAGVADNGDPKGNVVGWWVQIWIR